MENEVNLTKRMKRVIGFAEEEVELTVCNGLMPIHLLIACLREKTGVLGEIYLKSTLEVTRLREMAQKQENIEGKNSTENILFTVPITTEANIALNRAIAYMKRYNQTYLNEGHLLKALVNSEGMDRYLSHLDKEIITTIGTAPRDMITSLGDYSFPNGVYENIRKANQDDIAKLIPFVEQHFSREWSQTIQSAATLDDPPVYIAFDGDEEMIGFATYDLFQNKKCYFGPMGVARLNRVTGIGFALLHYCLRDMKQIGYEYAIIGGAGPIEFYERACNAVVIPAM